MLSLLAAYLLNCVPAAPLPFLPDWLALVLCFWAVHRGPFSSMSWALCMGLVMDVTSGAVLGQHSLAYVLVVYLAMVTSNNLLWNNVMRQGLRVVVILLCAHTTKLLVGMATGGAFPGPVFFLAPLIAALLWGPLTYLLLLPQFGPVLRDEIRPIHISKNLTSSGWKNSG